MHLIEEQYWIWALIDEDALGVEIDDFLFVFGDDFAVDGAFESAVVDEGDFVVGLFHVLALPAHVETVEHGVVKSFELYADWNSVFAAELIEGLLLVYF